MLSSEYIVASFVPKIVSEVILEHLIPSAAYMYIMPVYQKNSLSELCQTVTIGCWNIECMDSLFSPYKV